MALSLNLFFMSTYRLLAHTWISERLTTGIWSFLLVLKPKKDQTITPCQQLVPLLCFVIIVDFRGAVELFTCSCDSAWTCCACSRVLVLFLNTVPIVHRFIPEGKLSETCFTSIWTFCYVHSLLQCYCSSFLRHWCVSLATLLRLSAMIRVSSYLRK